MDLILVVLYKQKVSESITLSTLLNCKNKFDEKLLFVWDNSPVPLEEFEIIFLENQFKNFKYINSNDNKSLSEVYNSVIKNNKFDKIYILDQDTTLTYDYFDLMDNASLSNKDIGLFLPFVKNDNRIVSPLSYRAINFMRYSNMKKGKTLAKNKIAIASGLCINEWVFKINNIWFDENLNFYGVDNKFILDYGDYNKYMFIIDYKLKHSLSFTEEETKEIKVKRFDSNTASSFYLANIRFNIIQKIIVVIRSIFNSFKMALKYNDFIFYTIFFKNFNKFIVKGTNLKTK